MKTIDSNRVLFPVQLVIGIVTCASEISNSNKPYVLEVNLGLVLGTRQIVAALKAYSAILFAYINIFDYDSIHNALIDQ